MPKVREQANPTLLRRTVIGHKPFYWLDTQAREGEYPRKRAMPGDTVIVTARQAQQFPDRLIAPAVARAQEHAKRVAAQALQAQEKAEAEARRIGKRAAAGDDVAKDLDEFEKRVAAENAALAEGAEGGADDEGDDGGDVDYNDLSVEQLRALLDEHQVQYSKSAKKADLVALALEHVEEDSGDD